MIGSAGDVDVSARSEADVVIAGDAALAHGIHIQAAFARKDDLPFAEEGGLLVLELHFGISVAVGQMVVGSLGQHQIERFATLVVDGCAMRVGEVHAIEREAEFLFAVNLERAVGAVPGEHIFHVLDGRNNGHVGAAGGDAHTGGLAADRCTVAVVGDGDRAGESGVLDVIAIGRHVLIVFDHIGSLAQVAVVEHHFSWCFPVEYQAHQ